MRHIRLPQAQAFRALLLFRHLLHFIREAICGLRTRGKRPRPGERRADFSQKRGAARPRARGQRVGTNGLHKHEVSHDAVGLENGGRHTELNVPIAVGESFEQRIAGRVVIRRLCDEAVATRFVPEEGGLDAQMFEQEEQDLGESGRTVSWRSERLLKARLAKSWDLMAARPPFGK